MDHTSLKKSLRKEILAKRKEMPVEEVIAKSHAMFERWRNRFSLKKIGYFHIFQSIADRREVDTREFIDFVWERHPQVFLVVPIVDSITQNLRHALVHEDLEMRPNKFGIPEPHMAVDFVHPVQLDMIIVPLLAFDDNGQRLGYGAGYYDRFLALTRPACIKIGLCFESGHQSTLLPAEPHDIPLDFVVTENNILRFNPNFPI
jgi:5-formyltetrahydrofolate cyclo-ligase